MKRLLSLLLSFAVMANSPAQKNQKPNVIFILTDDQGYGDLACHGNPWIKTPNMDKLYAESVCFTNFHVAPTCAPSRAGLMTGKYNDKVGVWHTVNGREILAAGETTLAEAFRDAGYRTSIFGKWHLGDNYPFRPQDRGFQEVLVLGGGGIGQQPDFWGNDYFDDTYSRNGKPEQFKGYCTDVWFDEAYKFMVKNKSVPFFCYLALNAPHAPYNVDKKYSDPYKGNPNIRHPDFYGMIANIDENIGKLRDELERLGIADNTIIVFMTDNGTSGGVEFDKKGNLIAGFNAGMRGKKGSQYEGGHRVPFFIYWKNGGMYKHANLPNLTANIDFMPTIMDLCGIPTSKFSFDGISLKPLIERKVDTLPDRILFTDNQREEHLVKWKQVAVMSNRWRMIDNNELYDINEDPSQTNNVAKEYLSVMEEFKAAYESWWKDVSKNANQYSYAQIGAKGQGVVRLNSHDCHVDSGLVAFSQDQVRAGTGKNGFMTIELVKSGTYEIQLCRYPLESGLKLRDSAPGLQQYPYSNKFSAGLALNLVKARIQIGDMVKEKNIDGNKQSVDFEMNLKEGKAFLQTWLIDSEGKERPAYYVYLKLKN